MPLIEHLQRLAVQANEPSLLQITQTSKSRHLLTVERTALDVLDFALLSAERFIQIRKQKEKNQMERELAGGKELIISVYKGCIQSFIFGYFIAKNSKWFNELLICSFRC